MIKNSLLLKIHNVLDADKNFGKTDFVLITDKGTLNISYYYDPNFYIAIRIPDKISDLSKTEERTTFSFTTTKSEIRYKEYEFSGTLSPGNVAMSENFEIEGVSNLMNLIQKWLTNLWSELATHHHVKKALEALEEIEKLKSKFDIISEESFSNEEISKLIQRLDTLEQDFKSKLEKEQIDKEILAQSINNLHSEIEKLKAQTKILNKRNWFKSYASKMFLWISKEENRKFLADSKDFIKPMLPESIKDIF